MRSRHTFESVLFMSGLLATSRFSSQYCLDSHYAAHSTLHVETLLVYAQLVSALPSIARPI